MSLDSNIIYDNRNIVRPSPSWNEDPRNLDILTARLALRDAYLDALPALPKETTP